MQNLEELKDALGGKPIAWMRFESGLRVVVMLEDGHEEEFDFPRGLTFTLSSSAPGALSIPVYSGHTNTPSVPAREAHLSQYDGRGNN